VSVVQVDSPLPQWIGRPPASWSTERLKWAVRLSTERPTDEEVESLPYIANEDIESWTGKLLNPEPQPAEADSRRFQTDDVLFNKLRPYLAKVYHARFDGVSSGELLCLRPSERLLPAFLFYVASSNAFIDAVDAETFGSKMPRADWQIVGHQPLPLPPVNVQQRIATFLDQRTAQIDPLIARKRELLERLAEKRQAIISQAVTKGLNPAAPMKDSGIQWFGDIPAHWQVKRLNSFCEFQSGKAHEPFVDPDGAFVSVNARFISTNGKTEKRCTENLSPATPGDILMVMSDLPSGRALARTFLVDDRDAYAVNQRVCRIRPHRGDPRYFSYQLNRNPQLLRHDDGNEQTHLPNAAFKQLLLLEPPLHEQPQIAAYLDEILQRLDTVKLMIDFSLSRLAEYRFALVTAAVTGQVEGLN
jgi:type I restriction enzyme S subunit